MKKLLLKISPTFLIIFYRSIKSQVVNLIVRNTPRGNKDEYLKLYNQSLTREYPIIEEFLKNKIRDDDFINELALTTQISIKGSEPNFQHGKIIYALLGDYNKKVSNGDSAYTFLDVGTAKGFSAIIMSRFIINNSLNADIHTVDIIGHNNKKYWNSILDVEKGKLSRKEFLEPYNKYLGNITFHKGKTKKILPKIKSKRINFAFIDGSHEYEDVLFEYNFIKSKQKKGDIILFDDVTNKFEGIKRLINEIAEFSLYSVKKIESSKFRAYAIAERLS